MHNDHILFGSQEVNWKERKQAVGLSSINVPQNHLFIEFGVTTTGALGLMQCQG